ncbi:MAG: YCF48-related protein, partial [Candidatus Aminicenantes bacterium]|nr:YCF48-related protein [Candidatus Aminicenantes bacterium]
MKKILIRHVVIWAGVLALAFVPAFAQGTWSKRNQEITLTSVQFVNPQVGWSVGASGTVLKTTNGGQSWFKQTGGTTSLILYGVYFTDAETGWAVGEGGLILYTTNGGTAWTAQTGGTNKLFRDVFFVDQSTGWIVGNEGTILKTENGGATWSVQTSGTGRHLCGVFFVDANTGWAAGDYGRILKTANGGTTWISQDSGTAKWLFGVHFVDSVTGWAAGYAGTILKTSDGGATWSSQYGGSTDFQGVHFVDAKTGWVVGAEGAILKTTDGGVTWNAMKAGASGVLYHVHFVDADSGWIVGNAGVILHSADGGVSWTAQSMPMQGTYSLCAASPSLSWAVGFGGIILKTTDGWTSWTVTMLSSKTLYGVYFTDAETGWAVGYQGTIIKTVDGGESWTAQTSGTTNRLSCVQFVNGTTGWAAGDNGVVLKTVNGGLTWTWQDSDSYSNLSSLFFIDVNTGWIVGDSGLIRKTTNGGTTWVAQDNGIPTGSFLRSVHFVDGNKGWVLGNLGVPHYGGYYSFISATLDGGTTWTTPYSQNPYESPFRLSDLHFADADNGWAVGDSGNIIHTADGGATWAKQNSGTTAPLSGVYFINPGLGWAVGDHQILKYTADTAPSINISPLSRNISSGQKTTLNVAATGGEPLHYRWFQGDSGDTSTPVGSDASIYVTPSLFGTARFWVRVTNTVGQADSQVAIVAVGVPQIGLSRRALNFGSSAGLKTRSQNVLLTNGGTGLLLWTASSSPSWLTISPRSGIGDGVLQIDVSAAGLAAGTYMGSVVVSDANALNSPQSIMVTLTLNDAGTTFPPFGDFATPLNNTIGITGAIPVTGWVLDDIETTKVEIWRDPVAGEGSSIVFIGSGIFVEGARPDVEANYPTYPLNYRSGWGYMLLTNFLPGQGNGTYKLYAYATDKEGNQVSLGTKTITCDNAHASKPFGTIDTPTQGGDASGSLFVNFGWVLTPMPKTVPKNGSTISVWVDG